MRQATPDYVRHWTNPGTAGPRAVLGSQQPRTDGRGQISSTLPVQSHALRAGDGSRSAPSSAASALAPSPTDSFTHSPTPLTLLATTRKHLETSLARLHDDRTCAIERSSFGQQKARTSRRFQVGWLGVVFALLLLGSLTASAQTNFTAGLGPVQITLGGANGGPQTVDTGIKVLF